MFKYANCGGYREMGWLVHPDGEPVYGDKPCHDLVGKPFVTRDGKYPVLVPPLDRDVYVYGAVPEDVTRTVSVASALGRSLDVRELPHRCVHPCSILGKHDLYRWVYVVFDLAWASNAGHLPGASFSAEKMICIPGKCNDDGDGMRMPLRDLGHFKNSEFPWLKSFQPIPDEPNWFYSIIDDFVSASIGAIDVLLSHHAAPQNATNNGEMGSQAGTPGEAARQWTPRASYVGRKTICTATRFQKQGKNPVATTIDGWVKSAKRKGTPIDIDSDPANRENYYPEAWIMERIGTWNPRVSAT
jgi:hypothetical protein